MEDGKAVANDVNEAIENGKYYMKNVREKWSPRKTTSLSLSRAWTPPSCATASCGCACNESHGAIEPPPRAPDELETKGMKAEGVNVLDWDGNDIMNTEECIRIEVAMDSGAIAHVMRPDCVPAGVKVDETHARNFTAANGGAIKNYGKARVEMMDTLSKNRNECINNVA